MRQNGSIPGASDQSAAAHVSDAGCCRLREGASSPLFRQQQVRGLRGMGCRGCWAECGCCSVREEEPAPRTRSVTIGTMAPADAAMDDELKRAADMVPRVLHWLYLR